MTVARLQIALGGSPVAGPGVMTLYTRNLTPGTLPGAIKSFFTTLTTAFPQGMTMDVPNAGDTINEETGALVGGWSGSGGGLVTMTGQGSYALGVGGRLEWVTSVPVFGHHARGRSFLAPLVSAVFGADGKILPGTVGNILGAANTLFSAGNGDLVVWVRPRVGYVGKKGPLPDRLGAIVPITSVKVPSLPTSLKSRRT